MPEAVSTERELRVEAAAECVRAARERHGLSSAEYRAALEAWERVILLVPLKALAGYRRTR